MKKTLVLVVVMGIVFLTAMANAQSSATNSTEVRSDLNQYLQADLSGPGSSSATAQGGDAGALALSGGSTSSITTISKGSEIHTGALGMNPPYLPYWAHAGWGLVEGFSFNSPNRDAEAYECQIDPLNREQMKEIKKALNDIDYKGPFELLGGILSPGNLTGGKFNRRVNSIIRKPRRPGQPLVLLIDNVDYKALEKDGYVYVGEIGIEGGLKHNFDQIYTAIIAEVLPWDVDLLLFSGGGKGVTIGSTRAFPNAAGAYTSTDFSVSSLFGDSQGIVEGSQRQVIKGVAYRKDLARKVERTIPESIANYKLPKSVKINEVTPRAAPQPQNGPEKTKKIVELETKRE